MKQFIILLLLSILSYSLYGQETVSDSIIKQRAFVSEEISKAFDAIHDDMPYTAIEILEKLKVEELLDDIGFDVLSLCYSKIQDYDKIIDLYKERIKETDKDAFSASFLAVYSDALSNKGEYKDAIAIRERAISMQEKKESRLEKSILAEMYYYMSFDYNKIEQYEIAKKWIDKAIIQRFEVLDVKLSNIIKEEVQDDKLEKYFDLMFALSLIEDMELNEEKEFYCALAASCGSTKAKKFFNEIGKNYKKILKRNGKKYK